MSDSLSESLSVSDSDCLSLTVGLSGDVAQLEQILTPPCKDRKFRGSFAEHMPSVSDENTHLTLSITLKPCLHPQTVKMSSLCK